MKSFKLTFLPSVKNEFSNDPLIENWVKQLTDSYDFIKVEYPSNKEEAIIHLRDSDAVYGVLTEDLLLQCNNLKWLQAPQAAPPMLPPPKLLSRRRPTLPFSSTWHASPSRAPPPAAVRPA